MAVSDVGVACHRKMKRVGQKILGSFTVCHKKASCDFDVLMNWAVLDNITFGSSLGAFKGSSCTRPATAEVIKGITAVTPNTYLYHRLLKGQLKAQLLQEPLGSKKIIK